MARMFQLLRCCLACLVLAACTAPSGPYEPDREPDGRLEMGLRGPVEVMLEVSTKLGNDREKGWDTLEVNSLEIRFDSAGRPLSREMKRDGMLVSQFVYSYDSAGRPIEDVELGKDGRTETTRMRLYGRNGKLEEMQDFTGDGKLFSKISYEYDEENRVTRNRMYFYNREEGSGRETKAYESEFDYESDGDYVQKDFSDGELTGVWIFRSGKLQRAETYGAGGDSLTFQKDYQWTEEGRRSLETKRDGLGNLVEAKEQVRGPFGMVQEKILGPDSLLDYLRLAKYDEEGRPIETWYYVDFSRKEGVPLDTGAVQPTVTRTYYEKFDAQGNWTESSSYESDSLRTEQITRKFIYFPAK